MLTAALEDDDSYVRGNSVHALYRVDTPNSRDAMPGHLMAARRCHSTVEGSHSRDGGEKAVVCLA